MSDFTPVCRKCNSRTVKANAGITNDIPFYVCRNCKIEVDSMGYEVMTDEEFDSAFEGSLFLESVEIPLVGVDVDSTLDAMKKNLDSIKKPGRW